MLNNYITFHSKIQVFPQTCSRTSTNLRINSTIFKTFDSDIDKASAKIGVFGKSFNEIFEARNKRRLDIDNLMYYEGKTFKEAKKDVDSFWSYLYQKKESFDWRKTASGEIVNSENIDSYISEITPVRANTLAEEIAAVQRANGSWSEFYNTLSEGEKKYVVDLVKNTEDLSKLTGDDLVKANQNARQAAIAHNAALKQQTLGAKAAKFALSALATVGNMLLITAITKGVEWLVTYNQRLEENRQEMIEAGKEASQLTKDLDGLVEQYRKLGEDGKLDNSDREQAKNIQQQINDLLGDEVNYIDLANGKYEAQLKTLQKIQYEKTKDNYKTISDAKVAAEDSLFAIDSRVTSGFNNSQDESKAIKQVLKDYGFDKYIGTSENSNSVNQIIHFAIDNSSVESTIQSLEDMKELRDVLRQSYDDEINKGGDLEDFYNNLDKKIKELAEAVTKYKDALADYNINEAVIQFNETEFEFTDADGVTKKIKGALVKTKEQLNVWINGMLSSDIPDGVKQELIGLATTYFPDMSDAIEESTQEYIKNQVAAGSDIIALKDIAEKAGIATDAYVDLVTEQILLGNTNLTLNQQIEELEKLAEAIGIPLAEMTALQHLMANYTYDEERGYWVSNAPLDATGRRQTREPAILFEDDIQRIVTSSANQIREWTSNADDTDIDFEPDNSSKDKTQKSLDYTTFLDEQITDLQNKAKRLEDQISITEQQIANAEARGDTALANALKAQLVSQNEELQAIYHEVAEGLRRIKEEAAAELFGEGSDEYNRIIQDGEYLSEEWIAQRIRIENAGGDTTAIENEIKQVEELSGVINDCTDGIYEQQSAWWDVNTAIQDAKKEIINGYGDELDRATEKLTRGLQEQADAYNILIDKKEALLEADRKEIDYQREIRELQRNIQSELNASKTMTEYLDEDTRKHLFNEDDYNHLSSKLQGIATDIGDINDWYYSEINALTEDNWYLEEAITNEYERRLDAKMKEYELAEAELNLEKKKQQLNNAMNEKNVRMYIDGSWQYVADIDEVVRAQKELAEAQGEYDEIKQQQEEEAQLDEQERELDNLKTEQSAIEKQIEMIEDQTNKIKTAMEEYLEPIRDLEDIISDIASMTIPGLQTQLDKFISMIRKANGTDTGGTVITGGGSTRPGKGYIDPDWGDTSNTPAPNAMAWIPGIGNAGVYINPQTGKTEADLPVGTIITPNGSDTSWEITGGTQGDYTSVIVPNDKQHADGVLSAPKGLSLINDGNGLEMLRTKLGDLVYMNGGETVFNGDQTRFLYNLSKNPMSYLGALAGQNNAGEHNIHNFYGDIIIEDVNDPNEFMQKLTTMLKHNSFK